MNVFGKYSDYYNLLYKDKDYAAEAEYIHNLIQRYDPSAKSVLNLGCGTGGHDFPLARKKYEMTGVDMSNEMLAVANSQLLTLNLQPSAIHFVQGDIRKIRIERIFDVVISLFHVMSYQTTNDDIMATLDTVRGHLKDDGLFIFDFWYGPAVLTDRPAVRVKRLEDEELSVYRIATPVIHLNENIVDVNYEVLIEDRKTKMLDKLQEIHNMRYFFLPELEFILTTAGFSVVADRAWMHLDRRLDSDTWYGVVIARK